jgi:hypothetical protein
LYRSNIELRCLSWGLRGLWGSKIRFRPSCGQLGSDVVFVGESAEDLFPVDPVLGEVDRLGRAGRCLSRGELAEGAMRPGRVVVRQAAVVTGRQPVNVREGLSGLARMRS